MSEPMVDVARLRALLLDNERQRALTIEAHERALSLAKRCDALEAERDALRLRAGRGIIPFGGRSFWMRRRRSEDRD